MEEPLKEGKNGEFYKTRESVRKGEGGSYLEIQSALSWNTEGSVLLNHGCFLGAQGSGKF